MAQGRVKNLYKCYLNFQRETCIEYVQAYSESQARTIAFRRVAKKHDVGFFTVFNYFKDHPQGVDIQVEIKYYNDLEPLKNILDRIIDK